jgi:hypothetical protein
VVIRILVIRTAYPFATYASVPTSKRKWARRRRGIAELRPDMKYLTILCLSLGLTGCFGFEPYASATGPAYGPLPDLGACARSPEPRARVDQLCNRQDANPYGSN